MKESHKKVGIVAASFTLIEVFNHSFDFIMYPLVIGLMGPLRGGIIMTILALALNYGMVIAYRKTDKDWFGFEWLELRREEEGKAFWGKFLKSLLKIGYWPAFIFLCWEDPFKAFVYVRGRKSVGSKFSKLDWTWFFLANLIGNLIWIILVSGAIEFIKFIIP